ncbi:stage II sporulation protein D [Paenibacillus sp. L3-i20]|uniref:stage II sporulation protein D n=1 Tax=Paenibacillus sp. L3-i20 TaxID=2905833 RepID=UPI001EDCE794|nr:stage II sporulation protein D [Paenibacillus sp. L3-i20]GKU76926.1 stage II sporulation protein D [Paenibacillus sp. L3-i20]
MTEVDARANKELTNRLGQEAKQKQASVQHARPRQIIASPSIEGNKVKPKQKVQTPAKEQSLEKVQKLGSEKTSSPKVKADGALDGTMVSVYLTDQKKVETVPIETYVLGVLAAEMPIDFHLEALKAQAVAARTYIVRRLMLEKGPDARGGKADVLNTTEHQVYLSQSELAKRWKGEDKVVFLAKLKRAVDETKGLIVTYKGEPIEATFFSTSNGYTENSEDYWEQSLPYLRSVISPWDKKLSPRYEGEVVFKRNAFYRTMGLSGKLARTKLVMKVTERTDGNRIKELTINGKAFSGREVRERLGLASSQFKWKIEKDKIIFTTYGFGHGVGMSQWGANGMAQEGRSAEEILLHYYTDSKLEQASKLPI